MCCAMSNKLFLHDSLVEQSTQGNFVPQGRQDILTIALGILKSTLVVYVLLDMVWV